MSESTGTRSCKTAGCYGTPHPLVEYCPVCMAIVTTESNAPPFNYSTKRSSNIDFGDYVLIEQHRYGADNEWYLHKVIRASRSVTYVDVPVTGLREEKIHIHTDVVDVISCICCGIDETKVFKYRVQDVRLNTHDGKVVISRETEQYILNLYRRANELLCFVTAEGEMSTRDGDYVGNLSDSLFALDGGTFEIKAQTLEELSTALLKSK